MTFERNLATGDKIVRLVFGGVVIILFLLRVIGGPWAAVLLSLSCILVVTALVSFCPVYKAFGINHRKASASNKET